MTNVSASVAVVLRCYTARFELLLASPRTVPMSEWHALLGEVHALGHDAHLLPRGEPHRTLRAEVRELEKRVEREWEAAWVEEATE